MAYIKKYKFILLGALVLIIAGVVFFMVTNKGVSTTQESVKTQNDQTIKQIKPEDIGLTLTPTEGKKSIVMAIDKLSDIVSVEYEVNYTAEGNIPRGVIGTLEVKDGEATVKRDITLGTCSKNVCKYDKGVTEVDFVIKVNYKNGEVGSIQQKVTL